VIRHLVLFRFKADTPQSDREAFLEMLRALPSKISRKASRSKEICEQVVSVDYEY